MQDAAATWAGRACKCEAMLGRPNNAGCSVVQAGKMAKGLAVSGDKAAAAQQIKNLYKLFVESDCTMVEV